MNIEQFRAAAQKAAKQLSSLDEMAENDEYIQSPDLNVSKRNSGSSSADDYANSSAELPAVVEDLSSRFVDAISAAARSTPSRSGSSVASSKSSTPRTQSPKPIREEKQAQRGKSKLLPSVAAVYEQSSDKRAPQPPPQIERNFKPPNANKDANNMKSKHALLLQELDYDSDSSHSHSSGSDQFAKEDAESHDALHKELQLNNTDYITNQKSSSNNGKDPNRFMKMTEELESEREVLIARPPTASTTNNYVADERGGGLWNNNNMLGGGSAGDETNKAIKKGLDWVQRVATPQINAISQHIMKVADNTSRADNSQGSNNDSANGPMISSRSKLHYKESDEENNISFATSSNFLSADDLAEFEKMRSKSSLLVSILEAIRSNQRLAFVAFTLLLSMFAYFYSRKRSVDDVL